MRLDKKTKKPRNPMGRTGMTGRGMLGAWGPNQAADPIVVRLNAKQQAEVLLMFRPKGGQWGECLLGVSGICIEGLVLQERRILLCLNIISLYLHVLFPVCRMFDF